jgi:hypothetical protein
MREINPREAIIGAISIFETAQAKRLYTRANAAKIKDKDHPILLEAV